jgi:hypothetical protein
MATIVFAAPAPFPPRTHPAPVIANLVVSKSRREDSLQMKAIHFNEKEIAMKFTLTSGLAAAALIAGSACAAAADDFIVSGNRTSPPLSLDQKATNACFNAFVAELLPGNTARVRTVFPSDSVNVFTYEGDNLVDPYKIMLVEMTAKAVHGNELLAKSICTVNRHAKVLRLSTHATAAAKRAGLTLKDINLAMTVR